MPIRVDDELLDHMRRSSGAIDLQVRKADDPDLALQGLRRARRAIFRIPHPLQPDEPYAPFASDVELGPEGPSFWIDMADAEAHEGILEDALERVLIALEETGLKNCCLTWPEGSCERTAVWQRDPGRRLQDISDWTGDPPPPETPHHRQAETPPVRRSPRRWLRRGPLLTPRSGLAATRGPDGRIYAIGGATRAPVKTVEAYDPEADSWRRVAPMRFARRGPGAVLGPDHRIYAIGGFGGERRISRFDAVTTVEAYDPARNRWEEVAPMSHPHARNEIAAACGSDGRIYAVAATRSTKAEGSSSYERIFEAYDPSRDKWTPRRPPPAFAAHIGMAAGIDGRIYVLGATYPDLTVVVEAYDPSTDGWEQVSSPALRRSGFGTAVGRDGRIYVVGGEGPDGKTTSAVEAYDPKEDRWETDEAMPTPRHTVSVAAGLDGSIFAVGGHTGGLRSELLGVVEAYRFA